MSKKILSVVLALVLVMSTFALSAFAASKPAYEEDPSEYTQAWRLEDASVGDVYKANIYLEAAYGVGAVQFKIESAEKAVLTAVDSDVFVGDYDINFSPEGLVFIVPTPTEGTESMDAIEFADETLIATLTFELAEGASSATVSIENAPKNEENPDGTLVAARVDDGNLVTGTSIVGQDATVDGSATFGAAAKPELVLKNGVTVNTGYCNTANTGVIFGFGSFGKETNYRASVTSTLGDEYIVYEKSASGKNGTGAVLKLVDTDGTVLESYQIVVFGDINGDGRITNTDAEYLIQNPGIASSKGADKLAANVNGDARHAVTNADIETFIVTGVGTLSTAAKQQALAATY